MTATVADVHTPPPSPAGADRWTPRQRAMLAELGLADWAPVRGPGGAAAATPPSAALGPRHGTASPRAAVASAPRTADPPVDRAPTGPRSRDGAGGSIDAPSAGAVPAAAPRVRPSLDRVAAATTAVDPSPRADGVASMDWDTLAETVSGCRACRLCEGRTRTVFGTGPREAHWLVVGEAPGAQEDLQGEPFVGKSGQLLDAMLRALGLSRAEDTPPERAVYIANTVKCRPPGNRNPQPDELATCEPYLMRQIALLKPRMVLAMGRFAVQSLLRSDEPVGRLRGRVHRYQGVPLVVTFHPAYLLRSPQEKARAWDDLCLARAALRGETA